MKWKDFGIAQRRQTTRLFNTQHYSDVLTTVLKVFYEYKTKLPTTVKKLLPLLFIWCIFRTACWQECGQKLYFAGAFSNAWLYSNYSSNVFVLGLNFYQTFILFLQNWPQVQDPIDKHKTELIYVFLTSWRNKSVLGSSQMLVERSHWPNLSVCCSIQIYDWFI